jgi:single-strand DNA-binding protein
MANLNRVQLIGRLTRDPELKTFAGGGAVCNMGFAVNNRKKNQQTGEWEDEPVWIDLKAFDRDTGRKLATLCNQYLKKGHLAYVEGRLTLEQWEDRNGGGKRQALRVIVEDVQFLEKKEGGGEGGQGYGGGQRQQQPRQQQPARPAPAPAPAAGGYDPNYQTGYANNGGGGGADDDIPF